MLSGWIGVCGCMACAALLDSASVPADMGLPACEPALKFWAKPSGRVRWWEKWELGMGSSLRS
ncbi:hypothetical protein B1R94_02560 [Mycolicibacterium litorale]|nr:hypothetical protein B1R94_02560 [Mycolicibacterium litorale]